MALKNFKAITFTHKLFHLNEVGLLHLDEQHQQQALGQLKLNLNLTELMYLSTCNRVEFFFISHTDITPQFVKQLCVLINPTIPSNSLATLVKKATVYEDDLAIKHVFELASSLDSLVVGEREIITQVRKAFEQSHALGLTGDTIRLIIKHTIETAKQIYTDTQIAQSPVSIVSIAYRSLLTHSLNKSLRILIVGAGETNTLFATYLKKHQFKNVVVFNRTLNNAETLAKSLNAKAYALSDLKNYSHGFDVLITCTGSQNPIITSSLYQTLLNNETTKKIIVDLALPSDIDTSIINANNITYIDLESLKNQVRANLKKREAAVAMCNNIINEKTKEFELIYKERQVELEFKEIPQQVKQVTQLALNEVFYKEIVKLNSEQKQLIEDILTYTEKKYNTITLKTVKKLLLKDHTQTQ